MNISKNITDIKASLPENVTLVAVSKFHPKEAILEAYNAGQRIFGESRAQELLPKYKELPKDIEWHFIGSLQSNKVKEIAPFITLIHSIDSLKLLQEVNKQAEKQKRKISVLLEIYIAEEEAKHGFTPKECMDLFASNELHTLPYIQIAGLMGMATFTEDQTQIIHEFQTLHQLFEQLKSSYFSEEKSFNTLSMGMSQDYMLAIKEGSTMVRIGTDIFGEREY